MLKLPCRSGHSSLDAFITSWIWKLFCTGSLLLLLPLLVPVSGWAATLGNLTVISAPTQPFAAEVDLVAIKEEEEHSLTARIARMDPVHLSDGSPSSAIFNASIEVRPDGRHYISITFPHPVVDPVLNFVVELNWTSGSALREYLVSLAPPEGKADRVATQVDSPVSDPDLVRQQNEAAPFRTPSVGSVHDLSDPADPGPAQRHRQGDTVQPLPAGTANQKSNTGSLNTPHPSPPPVPGRERDTEKLPGGEPIIIQGDSRQFTGERDAEEPLDSEPLQLSSPGDPQSAHTADLLQRTNLESMFDSMDANKGYVGGALVLLIAGLAGVWLSMSRRPKQLPGNGGREGVTPATAGSTIHAPGISALQKRGEVTLREAGMPDEVAADVSADRNISSAAFAGATPAEEDGQEMPADVPGDSFIGDSSQSFGALLERGLAEIDLHTDQPGKHSAETASREGNPYWHEITSRIDLARAYREMGDIEAATQVLEEVVREGDSQQQEIARSMLARLRNASAP